MTTNAPDPTAPGGMTKAQAYQAARTRTLKRVHRYKRGFTAAAIVGFGVLGLAIARPNLSALAASQDNQTTQSTPTSSSNFFSQSGGTVNATATSTQTPVSTTATS